MKYTIYALALLCTNAFSFNVLCKLPNTTCIKSQGTEIPSKRAIEILDRCDEFIVADIGRIAMKLSYQQVQERTNGKLTPLARSWHAYGDLIDSPLRFERKARAEDAKYAEIKRACLELTRDFNDDSKWIK